jgi:hypothetical protein
MDTEQLDCGDCPACFEPLKLERDDRMRTGWARVCNSPACPDGGGAWAAQEWLVAKAQTLNLIDA